MKDNEPFAAADFFVYGFPSSFSQESFGIDDAVHDLANKLEYAGISRYRNIVFVCHSMGGLVAERYLLTYRTVAQKVPLLFLFSTPQEGAPITQVARHIIKNPGIATMLPGSNDQYLKNLDREWKQARKDGGIATQIRCAYETKKTFGIEVVNHWSGTRFCEGAAAPVHADHLEIVKPPDAHHASYVALANAYREMIQVRIAKAEAIPLPAIRAQAVRWGPDNRRGVGIEILTPQYEFIPWEKLENEILFQLLNRVDQVPYGSSVRVGPSVTGEPDMIVGIFSPKNVEVGHVWLGGDPRKNWVHDGEVRLGTPATRKAAARIWGTFQRHTDGSYVQVTD